jgi:hypothetical protein
MRAAICPHPADLGHPAQHAARQGEETIMVTRSTEVEEQSASGGIRTAVYAVAGLLLAMVVVAGMGIRQHTLQQNKRTAAPVASPPAEPVAVIQKTAVFGASATPEQIESSVFTRRPVLYIVGSEEEATWLRDTITAGNRLLDGMGKPPFSAEIVVVTSTEVESELMRVNADLDAIRVGLGLPGLMVLDLRAGER